MKNTPIKIKVLPRNFRKIEALLKCEIYTRKNPTGNKYKLILRNWDDEIEQYVVDLRIGSIIEYIEEDHFNILESTKKII